MQRRTVLAGLAGVGGLASVGTLGAYGLGVFDEPPFTLAVYNATGDETDVTCSLPAGFLDDHPAVATLVDRVEGRPVTDPARRRISRERATTIVSDLAAHCENTGGLYDIGGEWYFISVSGEGAHSHDGDTGDNEH